MPRRQQLVNSFLERIKTQEFWLHCVLFTFISLAFWPMTKWFAVTAHEQSRILHALVVILMAAVLLVRFNRIQIIDPFRLNKSSRNALLSAFALLIGNFIVSTIPAVKSLGPEFLKWFSLVSIPAYCLGLASFVLFVFGEKAKRVTITVASTLCVFLLLSLLMDPLDWPLRSLAGKWSGTALTLVGKTVEMGLLSNPGDPPKLILLVDQQPFHVASECNGFGVIITSLLLAFLLGIYRRHKPIDFILNVIVGLFLGFAFNTLRIFIIVLLAPSMMEHYHLMHEIVGTITYWGCLILVWILLNGPVRDEEIKDRIKLPS